MIWLLFACQNYQAEIVPASPNTSDDLLVEVLSRNGEKVPKMGVSWYQEDILRYSGSPLPSEQTSKGEQWSAQAFLHDGTEVFSEPTIIGNAKPEIRTIRINPDMPVEGYPVTCEASAEDKDSEALNTVYRWRSPVGDLYDGQLLDGAEVTLGEWRCEASVDDGTDTTVEGVSFQVEALRAPPENIGNLVSNPSFEERQLSEWSYENCSIVSLANGRMAVSGTWMLFGDAADCRAWQEMDLLDLGYQSAHIDSIRLQVRLEAYLANNGIADDFDDQIRAIVYFYDRDGASLGQLETLIAGEEAWVLREARRMIPVGTRQLRVELLSEWRADQQNDSFADDVFVTIEMADPMSPTLTKAPMLLDYRQDTMKVAWETDGVDHDPQIVWGDNLEHRVSATRSVWLDDEHVVHLAEISGLTAGQAVQYKVDIEDSDVASFRTAPRYGDDFSMVWLADNQEGYIRFTTHVAHIDAREPDLLFVAGDLVQYGSDLFEWEQLWWAPLQEQGFAQSTPVLAARGNHDLDHPYAYAYVDLPENGAWYSFLYGDVYFLVLNTHAKIRPSLASEPSGQFDYIQEQLLSVEAQQAAFRIVTFHQAPFSNAAANSPPNQTFGNENARDYWVSLFEQYDVDMVVAGHYHTYQRGSLNDIMYVVVGGGGSTLLAEERNVWDWLDVQFEYQYSVMHREEDRLRWETYNLQDQLIDSFVVE